MDSKWLRRWTCCLAVGAGWVLLAGCKADQGRVDRHLHPAVFSSSFHGGSALDREGRKLHFIAETLGRIQLPTGHLLAIDPSAVEQASALTVSVPPGSYPVVLAITDDPNTPRVAFAQIVFTEAPVAYWKVAAPEGPEPQRLKAGRALATLGSFMDVSAAHTLQRLKQGEGFYGALDRVMAAPPTKPLRAILPAGDANVAVFASGTDDGHYDSYFAFSNDGRAVALLTDFGLVPWQR